MPPTKDYTVKGNWAAAPRARSFSNFNSAIAFAQRLYIGSLASIGVFGHKVIVKSTCADCGEKTMFWSYDVYGLHKSRGNCRCTEDYYHEECDACARQYVEGVSE